MHQQLPNEAGSPIVASAHLHVMGDEGVLFCPATQQIYYLNTSATYVWCALQEGLAPPEIADLLVSTFCISRQLAEQHVAEALGEPVIGGVAGTSPAVTGVPGGPGASAPGRSQGARAAARVPRAGDLAATPSLVAAGVSEGWLPYRLGTLTFTMRCPSDAVNAALRHLQVAAEPALPDPHLILDIQQHRRQLRLLANGRAVSRPCAERELLPRLHHLLLLKAYEASACLAAFHAAAVGRGTACLLLPGASGSGKSTLVAALVSQGYDYLTDELVLLSHTGSLCPLPVSLGLKRESWALLAPLLPQLAGLPVHLQEKGTEVRYLPPPAANRDGERDDLRAVVFPRYVAGARTQLKPLSAAEGLRRLTTAGYAVPGGLDGGVVSRMVRWISGQRCYELEVGNLQHAAKLAGELLE